MGCNLLKYEREGSPMDMIFYFIHWWRIWVFSFI